MMRYISGLLFLTLALLSPPHAWAQSPERALWNGGGCSSATLTGAPAPYPMTMDAQGNLCINTAAGRTGVGAMSAMPGGTTNGTAIGTCPTGASGVRMYLPTGASVTFTIQATQPSSAPSATFTASASTTGPNWDENLNGQQIYVTATAGSPLFRCY